MSILTIEKLLHETIDECVEPEFHTIQEILFTALGTLENGTEKKCVHPNQTECNPKCQHCEEHSSKSDSIQIGRTHLKNIAETFAQAGSLVDFVAMQIQAMHCEAQEIPHAAPATTLYQLNTILRNMDHDLMFRETTLREMLEN